MSRTRRRTWLLLAAVVIQAIVCTLGITWGLPTSAIDPYLFGDSPAPTGAQISQLLGQWSSPVLAADVSSYAQPASASPALLNATAEGRAEIVARYRLYSYHPDELLTLRALASMSPGRLQLDPKLYEYGGLWVYPVGIALRVASLLRLIDLRPDVAFYIDHPEAFARFYVVERILSAAWAIAGVCVVFALTARMAIGAAAPTAATLAYMLMPAVVSGAHEGKPHVAGAVLALATVLAAGTFVRKGGWRWAAAAGALCGATAGMDAFEVWIFLVVPTMVIMRKEPLRGALLSVTAAGAAGMAVFGATNPYVVLHALGDHAVLLSSVSHVQSFHQASLSFGSALRTTQLFMAAMSPPLFLAGVAGLLAMGARGYWSHPRDGLLLVVPCIPVTLQVALFARGEHMDVARFLVLPSIALAIGAVTAAHRFLPNKVAFISSTSAMIAAAAIWAAPYLAGFISDSGATTSRTLAAQRLEQLRVSLPESPAPRLGVYVQPAAHSVPPVNITKWQIAYLPPGSFDANVIVVLQDEDSLAPGAVPLSAANRTFTIERVS